ncbi:FliM/FliN family flagellar motor switch protein [Paracoccus aminophilus]|uniref:Type III secretion apparatus, subunit RhcQ n=1 Tax=Paracoccus aminophilus JCM 7686 TaxID=1367847 RepID=S5XUI9_PARAH|nr:FliM/FliN family flagellar motor switch protein [Paracoccus aminophilus]AGT08877.1 type III secretion apparatus, subunit RhcQ [Paracoccus aminophilus JCM 7686]
MSGIELAALVEFMTGDAPPGRDDDPRRGPVARRTLSAELAFVQNELCPRRAPVALRAGGFALQAALSPPSEMPGIEGRGGVWLALTIDGHPARIGLNWGQIRRLTGLPLESADPAEAALLMEEALTGVLDDLEHQTGLALRFTTLAQAPEAEPLLALQLRAEVSGPATPLRLNLPLLLSAGAGRALAEALRPQQRAHAQPLGLMLRVAVEVETMRLSLAELRGLRPGDALVLPDLPLAARLVVENQQTAPVQPVGEGPFPPIWALTAGLTPRAARLAPDAPAYRAPAMGSTARHLQDNSVTDHPSDTPATPENTQRPEPQAPATVSESESLDALEMRLSFRLGETLMTLAELRRAGPGTIVTLDRPDGALVEILANGQLIGTGEVIAVAGQRAVEIRSLFGES